MAKKCNRQTPNYRQTRCCDACKQYIIYEIESFVKTIPKNQVTNCGIQLIIWYYTVFILVILFLLFLIKLNLNLKQDKPNCFSLYFIIFFEKQNQFFNYEPHKNRNYDFFPKWLRNYRKFDGNLKALSFPKNSEESGEWYSRINNICALCSVQWSLITRGKLDIPEN